MWTFTTLIQSQLGSLKFGSLNNFFHNSNAISSTHNINSNNSESPPCHTDQKTVCGKVLRVLVAVRLYWHGVQLYTATSAGRTACIQQTVREVQLYTAKNAGRTAVYSKECESGSSIQQTVRGVQLHKANSARRTVAYSKECGAESCIQQTVWGGQLHTANSAGRTAAYSKECRADSCIMGPGYVLIISLN